MIKLLYFIAGVVPTPEELAEMATLRTGDVQVFARNARAAEADNIEQHDRVAGLVPWFYRDLNGGGGGTGTGGSGGSGGTVEIPVGEIGFDVNVSEICVDGFKGEAGSVKLVKNGIWYVGHDLLTKKIIALPRLGHSGWIPVGRVMTGEDGVVAIELINPVMPECRIPNTVAKIVSGADTKMVTMGPHFYLTENQYSWMGNLFDKDALHQDYRLPRNVSHSKTGSLGYGNLFNLAYTGFFGSHSGTAKVDTGVHSGITDAKPLNGRSKNLTTADIIVVSCLLGAEEMRLETIEPIVRNLRKIGVEVVLTTDFPEYDSFSTYEELIVLPRYLEGEKVREIAERYGCQFADTAAYMADAQLRYAGQGIDLVSAEDDLIGISAPAGRDAAPSCGSEVYCRAVRSVISVESEIPLSQTIVPDMTLIGEGGWNAFDDANGDIAFIGSSLRATKTASFNTDAWGMILDIPAHNQGDLIRLKFNLSKSQVSDDVDFRFRDKTTGQLAASVYGSQDHFETKVHGSHIVYFYADIDNADPQLEIVPGFSKWSQYAWLTIKDVEVFIEKTDGFDAYRLNNNQKMVEQLLPPSRLVASNDIPGDAFVILPTKERLQSSELSWPGGGAAGSFGLLADDSIPYEETALRLSDGDSAAIGANGMVSCGLIWANSDGYVSTVDDPSFDVFVDNIFIKNVVGIHPEGHEEYLSIFTAEELAAISVSKGNIGIHIVSTSVDVRLQIVALIAFTSEQTYVKAEEIEYVGSWSERLNGGSGMMGYATDTIGDYAFLKCPQGHTSVSWIVSGVNNSRDVEVWNSTTSAEVTGIRGKTEIMSVGHIPGADTTSYIALAQEPTVPNNTIDGWALHIGGAILVHDR